MKQKKLIELVPYNPIWPQLFAAEASIIKTALGQNCNAVHHIGSTSVPGLSAKPIIDIIIVVKDPLLAKQQLATIAICYKGEYNIPLHYGFNKREGTHLNVHVYQEGHPEIELNCLFRDYLQTHDTIRDEYALLKKNLLADPSAYNKDNSAFTNYTLKKGNFIRTVLQQADFNQLRILKCSDQTEWAAAQQFRTAYFFAPHGIEDPYTWTFNHPDHEHLILYQGTVIVGYAHLQLWPDSRAALRMIVVDEGHRNKNFGSTFLNKCEAWLKARGYTSIHTQARTTAQNFYKKNGYSEIPFNDPDGYENDPNDISLGKVLSSITS